MTARARRSGRAHERGLTLVELLVTLFLMSLGMVALLGLFSTIELSVGATNSDAQLATDMRHLEDYVESEQFTYIQCGTASAYQTALNGSYAAQGYAASVLTVVQALSGSQTTTAGGSVPLTPRAGCGSSVDYGVQQIQLRVSASGHSVTRVVYKRWN